jgi:V/A-type H+-transporting ATPase subunit E
MDNKLQELTDKLYNEGLSKGKADGEAFLEEAKKKAESIISDAKAQAESIKAQAEKDAAELRSKTESDIKMASAQTLQSVKSDIENMIVAKSAGEGVSKALSSEDFMKEIITAVAKNFSAENPQDISLVLPESLKAKLEPFVNGELSRIIGKGVTASFSKKIPGGFTIGPKDGSYFISLTDDTFKSLIAEYMRPATKKLLFGE